LAIAAILKAALKQMHVAFIFICALLYENMKQTSPIHQRVGFAGRTSLICLLACCVLRVLVSSCLRLA
jgi:hypothetical protein